MRVHTLLLAAALALGSLAPTPAHATSQVLLTDIDHAKEAHAVVLATVDAQKVALHPELQRPVTLTTVSVSEVLYGEAPSTLTIEQLGGEYEGHTLYIAGDARLKVGEQVVLFLTKRQGQWMMTAMEQSKYAVEPSVDGPVLHRELTSNFFLRGPEGALKQLPVVHDPDIRLEDMRKLLGELAKGGE